MNLRTLVSVSAFGALLGPAVASATPLISEVYLDPPGSIGDILQEFIEISGVANESLADIFFLQIENENNVNGTGTQGRVDVGFDLSSFQLGSNGRLVIASANSGSTSRPAHNFDPAATLLQGTTDFLGYAGAPGLLAGSGDRTENSGGTLLLIHTGGAAAPVIGQDFDTDDDGTLDLPAGYTVLDAIGLAAEPSEQAFGGLYGSTNFIAGTPGNPGTPGPDLDVDLATLVSTEFEIEYLSRDAGTGEWFAANLTNGPNLTRGGPDIPIVGAKYVISAEDTSAGSQTGDPEVSVDLPYGLSPLTPGSANILVPGGVIVGDFNADGFVAQGDLDLVLLNWGDASAPVGFDAGGLASGGPFDGLMSQNELDDVLLNWGDGTPPSVTAIPEPASLVLLATGGLLALRRRSHNG